MSAHYDDSAFSYTRYWQGREYEHQSEIIALNRLLSHLNFTTSADIGGGFGRLTPILARHSQKTLLIEPSARMRRLVPKNQPVIAGTATHTHQPDASLDCAMLIRVLHHLPNLQPVFAEMARIIKPHSYLAIEFANSANFKSRLASWLSGQPILPTPVDLRSPGSIRKKYIHFVNHHPATVLKTLRLCHFEPLRLLSVSNFRSPLLKKILPLKFLLWLETISQSLLSGFYFGPSIFVLARRFDPFDKLRVNGERSRTIDKSANL
ncbi:class I SAM-dependent methyltransferase [Candidatus Amesbacteria bacterium]|nr:class I SAM-dependent methyltransferase [Candidatus Amesbacteria bacterium]